MSSSSKHILFIQGGGSENDYEADAALVDSLRMILGETYAIHYPRLSNEPVPDLGRIKQIDKAVSLLEEEPVLVGHSFGASMLLKWVSETEVKKKIAGLFLIATPFWSGDEDWKEGFKLQENFADRLPEDVPVFFYHCRDDEEVPFAHLAIYRQKLPWAIFRELASGGHQLNNDLTIVANDIKSL
ncbi:alpha/beta fold hydrolase [Spirosoma knui]